MVPANVMTRLAVVVAVPVPKFKLLLPPKVKLPATVTALLFVSVIAPALVLSIMPAVRVTAPVPTAVALFTFSLP